MGFKLKTQYYKTTDVNHNDLIFGKFQKNNDKGVINKNNKKDFINIKHLCFKGIIKNRKKPYIEGYYLQIIFMCLLKNLKLNNSKTYKGPGLLVAHTSHKHTGFSPSCPPSPQLPN